MNNYLIDPDWTRVVNIAYNRVMLDLVEGESAHLLRDIKKRQVQQAEANLVRAYEVLLEKYKVIHADASVKRPNAQLSALLLGMGITTQSEPTHDDHDHDKAY